jgi:WxL domain surface cell wall-binding
MNARELFGRAKTRTAVVAGTATLLAGGLGASGLLPAASADAATCTGTAVAAGTSCTATGSATIGGGTLTLATMPTALGWSVTMGGLDSKLVDMTGSHTYFIVTDATGSGAGWNVTVSATTFTTGTRTLANAGTLSLNGSVGNMTSTTAPDGICYTGSTCTVPTNTTAYPVSITTAASSPTPVKIFDTAVNTGM